MSAQDLKLGQTMKDGTKYAGISPDTGRPMFVAPMDERGLYDFNQAAKRATEKTQETGRLYRVPTKDELNVIFNNRAVLGGFKTASYPEGWYWSSKSFDPYGGYCQSGRLTKYPLVESKRSSMSLRLVRG